MEPIAENAVDKREEIKNKLRESFDGKIVRKDLTKKIKEGANVPVYVLEFLLGQYCSSDDESIIEQGVQNSLATDAENAGLNKTPDGEGYFGYNAPRGAYIEVISYNKLVKDAKKRNQVLFDKLFRPKADHLIVLTGNED